MCYIFQWTIGIVFLLLLFNLEVKRTLLISPHMYELGSLQYYPKELRSSIFPVRSFLHPNCTHTSIIHFWKVCFVPLHLYKKPTFAPVFANWKKSEEVYKNVWKAKIAFSNCFAGCCFRDSMHPVWQEWPRQALPCKNSTSQHQAPTALNCVSADAVSPFISCIH